MGIYSLRPRLYQHLIPAIRRLVAQGEERGAKHLTHDEANYFLVAIVSEWRKIIKFDPFFLFESIFERTTILLYQFPTLRQKILLYVLREHNNCFVLDLSIPFFFFFIFFVFFFLIFFFRWVCLLFFSIFVFYLYSPNTVNFPVFRSSAFWSLTAGRVASLFKYLVLTEELRSNIFRRFFIYMELR